jgi:ketopantoate reductase
VKSTDTESGAAAIKPHLALDAVVLSLQNGGGFKIPWRDDRRSASRVVSVGCGCFAACRMRPSACDTLSRS